MKKVLLMMLTIGTAVFATAQSYNHDQPYYGNSNGHDNYRNSRVNEHDRYAKRPVNGHNNNVRNRTIVSIGVESHNNGYVYNERPTHGVVVSHNRVINKHERRENRHAQRDYRRSLNEHGY